MCEIPKDRFLRAAETDDEDDDAVDVGDVVLDDVFGRWGFRR